MTYAITTLEEAQQLAERAAETGLRPSNLEHGRVVDRFEVRPFSFRHIPGWGTTNTPDSWGVWPRWSYADSPDLGTDFGGPFVPVKDLR